MSKICFNVKVVFTIFLSLLIIYASEFQLQGHSFLAPAGTSEIIPGLNDNSKHDILIFTGHGIRSSRRLDRLYDHAETIMFNPFHNYVFMADLHRADGSHRDMFARNAGLFAFALERYGKNDFKYFEIGDTNDLWKTDFESIYRTYKNIFDIIFKLFLSKDNYFYIRGNHDTYLWPRKNRYFRMYDALKMRVSLDELHTENVFIFHGHQVELFNGYLNRFSSIYYRYCKSIIERILHIQEPYFKPRIKTEKRLYQWAQTRGTMVITGHTHSPAFASYPVFDSSKAGAYYFNVGSGIHPNGIMSLEIGSLDIGGENRRDVVDTYNNIRLCQWQKDSSGHIVKRVFAQSNLRELLLSL